MRGYRRNGAYPIKGIDTLLRYITIKHHLCRNGAYPIKGIDTSFIHILSLSAAGVEMERTRLRELTLFKFFIELMVVG